MLARLIENGLADRQVLACKALALADRDGRAVPGRHPGWGHRLFRHRESADQRLAFANAWNEVRSRKAMAIALAYLDARFARDRLALREEAVAKLRDNREIAGFRREAGLVSGLDVGLSGVMVDLDLGSIDLARVDLANAIDLLSAESGFDPAKLREWLAALDPLPLLDAGDAAVPEATTVQAHETLDAAGLALDVARMHSDAQDRVRDTAERSVADARLNYRVGKNSMAMLYVSEAAALAARESQAKATVAFDRAAIGLWTAQGRGFSATDPAPAPPGHGGASCDRF